jgi:transcriptional regulator with PAS, ATPase and Fis domain
MDMATEANEGSATDTTATSSARRTGRGAGDQRSVLVSVGRPEALRPAEPIVTITGDFLIGRGRAALTATELTLDDPALSRQHARLAVASSRAVLRDLGSKNGTYVDGCRIAAPTELRDGALIFAGRHVFVFRRVSEEELEAMAEEAREPLGPVPTANPATALVSSRLRRLARHDAAILLTGETGTGKEVFARATHEASGRAGPFLAINCAALPGTLIESELFGYARGAHSQAVTAKPGLVQQADSGTLFLDEIADMAVEVQPKLLRFLENKEWLPLGATSPLRADVRIIAASNRAGAGAAALGLRTDLLARLGARPVRLPPLRERIEDVGALIAFFMGRRGATASLSLAAFRALCLYAWPGNIRELRSLIEEAIVLVRPGQPIAPGDLGLPSTRAPADPSGAADRGARGYRRRVDGAQLEALLRQHQGNVTAVARALGRQPAVVWRWLRSDGVDPDAFRS